MTKKHLEAIDLDDLDHVSGGVGRDFNLGNINLGQVVNGINTIAHGGFNLGTIGSLANGFGMPQVGTMLGEAQQLFGNFQSLMGGLQNAGNGLQSLLGGLGGAGGGGGGLPFFSANGGQGQDGASLFGGMGGPGGQGGFGDGQG